MSTDTIRRLLGRESPLVSWETWDRIKHTEWFVFVSAVTFVALFPYFFVNAPRMAGYHGLVTTMLPWAIFALSFSLLLGQTGLLSFGHALFWGGAGYASGLFAIYVSGDPLLMVIVGVMVAVVFAFLTAFILLRLHTVYFAIVTLAFGQLLYYMVREPLEPWTGGINGLRLTGELEPVLGVINLNQLLPGVLGTLWRDNFYVFLAVFFVGVVVSIVRIRKSPYGLLFKAIRENETRTSFVGLDVWRYKFAAYLLSAAIAGLAGSLFVIETQFVHTTRAHWTTSGDLVVMTVLGGLGTLVGPILGAIVFKYFEGVVDGFTWTPPLIGEYTGAIGEYWLLMLAIAFTAVVWTYPTGIWGMVTTFTSQLRDPKQMGRKAKEAHTRMLEKVKQSRGGDR